MLANVIWQFQSNDKLIFTLCTGDKDLKQLLTDNVFILDPNKDTIYKKADFLREFGFEPKFIVDYLALLGDSADNVKGVSGIGEKKALKLIQNFNSIENIYEHIDEVEYGIAEVLRAGRDDAFASKKLIELVEIQDSRFKIQDFFEFVLDYQVWLDTLVWKWKFASFEKTLNEMKKKSEMPQQLGLF